MSSSITDKDIIEEREFFNARKKLSKVFKEWFRSSNDPKSLMPTQIEKLGWPDELKQDAVQIVVNAHRELEACQPMT